MEEGQGPEINGTDGVDPARSLANFYGKLTIRERRFLEAYMGPCEMNNTQAYLAISPNVTTLTARINGCRMLALIREKIGVSREGFLELFGLGIDRAMYEIDRRLRAEKVELFGGTVVNDPATGLPMKFEDNGTRMQATKLLAELHGLRKIDFSGSLSVAEVKIFLPDNGRGDGPK